MRLAVIGALLVAAIPSQANAASCRGYRDFSAVRTYEGTTCGTAKRVQRELYKLTREPGVVSVVEIRDDNVWSCRWRFGRSWRVTCNRDDVRGRFAATLAINF